MDDDMKIIRKVKKILFLNESLKDDEVYWDNKAKVMEWQKYQNKHTPMGTTNEELLEQAIQEGYNITWEEFTKDMPDYFIELSASDMTFAVGVGFITALTAMYVDRMGSEKSEKNTGKKSLEKRIEEITPKDYDRNNPFDNRGGQGHRKTGHDIFGFGKKDIPYDYMMRDSSGTVKSVAEIIGKDLGATGKASQLDLIKAFYGNDTNGLLGNIGSGIMHTLVHMAKDLVTPNGLPLPFTSFLNKYIENQKNVSGYSVENEFLDNVQKEFSTLRASDFTSVAFIRLTHQIFYKLKKKEWENFDTDVVKMTKAQLNIISYTSCIIVQMFLYLFQTKNIHLKTDRITNSNDGGTFNFIMFSLVLKNALQVSYLQSKTNKLLLNEQDQLIKELLGESVYMGQHFNYYVRNYDYIYDNNEGDYITIDELNKGLSVTPVHSNMDEDARKTIKDLENLKYEAILYDMPQSEFIVKQTNILNAFNDRWDTYLFESDYAERFYDNLNEILKKG